MIWIFLKTKKKKMMSNYITYNYQGIDNKLEYTLPKYYSKATLVLCPNHLAQQWQDEIVKNTSPSLSVVKITTIRELRSCTYGLLASAGKKYTTLVLEYIFLIFIDVVIVSYQFLKNSNYFLESCDDSHATISNSWKVRDRWVLSSLKVKLLLKK